MKQTGCNCRDRSECPPDHKCQAMQLIHQADVKSNVDNECKYYLGLTETTFKE